MNARQYLKLRNLIHVDKSDLVIGYDDGSEVSVVELLESYHEHKMELMQSSNKTICQCEMPSKIKGENKCWRCKKPLE